MFAFADFLYFSHEDTQNCFSAEISRSYSISLIIIVIKTKQTHKNTLIVLPTTIAFEQGDMQLLIHLVESRWVSSYTNPRAKLHRHRSSRAIACRQAKTPSSVQLSGVFGLDSMSESGVC